MKFNLSEITEVIEERRTIYPEQFSGRKVHREILEKMLNSAKWAPSHKLTQPWRFTVFMNEGLQKLANFHANTYQNSVSPEEFNPMKFDKLKTRPLLSSAVIALAMKRDEAFRVDEQEEIASTAIAVQNMCLVATAYGIGTYWGTGGMIYSNQMKEFLGLGKHDKVLGLLFVGYPKIDWPRKTPRRPIEYFTKWVED